MALHCMMKSGSFDLCMFHKSNLIAENELLSLTLIYDLLLVFLYKILMKRAMYLSGLMKVTNVILGS